MSEHNEIDDAAQRLAAMNNAEDRASELQTQLEDALGFDADSELAGSMSDEDGTPRPVVVFTEAAVLRVLELLKEAEA